MCQQNQTNIALGLIFFGISFVNCQASLQRSLPEDEGWAWAESFEYDFDGKKVDFQQVHKALLIKQMKIALEIGGPKQKSKVEGESDVGNICVACFSFVLDKKNDKNCKLECINEPVIVEEDSIDLLNQHVFVSGFKLKEPSTEFATKENTAFCCTPKKNGQPSEQAPSGSSATKPIAAFIHPPYEDYASPDVFIEKIGELYSGVQEDALPTKAKLALLWKNISKKILSGEVVSDDELFDKWFNSATKVLGFETHDKLGLFFCHNEDSEQKMMYYLSFVTDRNQEIDEGCKDLVTLISMMSLYFTIDPRYRCFLLTKLMRVCPPDRPSDGINSLIKELMEAQQKKVKSGNDELVQKISTSLDDLGKSIERIKPRTKSNMKRLEYLQYCHRQLDNFWKEKDSQNNEMKDRKIQGILRTLRDRNRDLESKLEYIPEIKDNTEKDSENKSETAQENKKGKERPTHYKKDQLVDNFKRAVQLVLRKFDGYFVKAIVLQINSTNDICFSCAPDLAQECIAKNSFAESFRSLVENLNPEREKPLFQVVYSCGNLRKGRESSRTNLLQPKIAEIPVDLNSLVENLSNKVNVDDDEDLDDKNADSNVEAPKKTVAKTIKFYQHFIEFIPEASGSSVNFITVHDEPVPIEKKQLSLIESFCEWAGSFVACIE